jgi:phage repressor protein C with HTH and peptisase S24 domain
MLQANLSVISPHRKGSFHRMRIADRIKFLRTRSQLGQEDFAKTLLDPEVPELSRLSRGAVGNWELGKKIKKEWIVRMAEVHGVTFDWLNSGKGDGPVIETDDHIDSSNVGTEGRRTRVGIQEIDVRVGLGGGGSTEGREVRHDGNYADPVKPEGWKFPARFMREEIRATESQVIILETDGDSMEPTIGSGERIIVHTGMRTPSPDGIFALRDTFGNIIAKRLQVLRKGDPPRILIISDNKAHATEEVGLDEITIVGRVLWGLKRL